MAVQKFADRVKDTAASITGTGSYTLNNSPPTGFQSFNSGTGDGNSTVYVATDGTNWEVCLGTYTDSTKALTRNLIASSTGSLISWSAATPTIFVVDPAELSSMMLWGNPSGRRFGMMLTGGTSTATITAGTVYAVPIFVPCFFTSITPSLNVTALFAGTATLDLAVYDNANLAPNSLIGSTTGINVGTSGSTGDVQGNAISYVGKPGLYWGAAAVRTNSPTVRVMGASSIGRWWVGLSGSNDTNSYGGHSVASGSLPSPLGSSPTTGSVPYVTLAAA
jgi:hypothetical protein